jgi:quinolinate synthase
MLTQATGSLIESLLYPGGFLSPLEIDEAIAERARASVERMVNLKS